MLAKYEDLVDQCEESGWDATGLLIEIGARGFVGHRVHSLLKDLGLTAKEKKELVKKMQETVEKASYYIWLK